MERTWYDSRHGERFFSSPKDTDGLRDPSSLLLDRIKRLLSEVKTAESLR
jgi:hypothetical protein